MHMFMAAVINHKDICIKHNTFVTPGFPRTATTQINIENVKGNMLRG